jgi:hypothetical protein
MMESTKFGGTLVGVVAGLLSLVVLVLVWGFFFYRGYGEARPDPTLSQAFLILSWGASAVAAVLVTRWFGGWTWLAALATAAAALPLGFATIFAIMAAACDGNWFGHSCAFS